MRVPPANSSVSANEPPAVRAIGVERRFGATRALKGVSLTLDAGCIHALVGENGAGKSTFLGVLAGRIAASVGKVEAFGATLLAGSPRAARAAGIVAIYQELTTVPARSACENVFLGQPLRRGPLADDRSMRRQFQALRDELDVDIPAGVSAGTLSLADRQLLEVMRALCADDG